MKTSLLYIVNNYTGRDTRQKLMPVEMKLTAGRDQPVDHQQLQYFFPPDRFASFRETFLPELIQPQLAPQLTGQPTVSKYARSPQFHFRKPYLNPIAHTRWNGMIVGKQAHRRVFRPVLIENRQALPPRFFLLVVDFS